MATTTYIPIQSYTVSGSSTTYIDFSSIGGYTHLVLISNFNVSTTTAMRVRYNNDTGSTYGFYELYSSSGSATAGGGSNQTSIYVGDVRSSQINSNQIRFMNYSNSTTYKNLIARHSNDTYTEAITGLWRNTTSVNSIRLLLDTGYFIAGSVFTIYGIQSVDSSSSTPKASGGTITTDMLYTYHTFTSVGTFTPSQDLTAEVLIIGGGGGSGDANAGGGGAGGVIYAPTRSLTNGTGYGVTIGSGGGANSAGVASTFNNLSATGGGYSIGEGSSGTNGGSGGGGGGTGSGTTSAGVSTGSSGTGYTFYGNPGGIGRGGYNSGGGGGAGAPGNPARGGNNGDGAGNGGIGLATWSSWLTATNTGHNVNGIRYIAGGGGGGANSGIYGTGGSGGGGNGKTDSYTGTQTPGTANTGGGAGGSGGISSRYGTNGGSGLVIIRYLKA